MKDEILIDRISRNIRNYAKIKKIKLGDIERSGDVVVGTVSRKPNYTISFIVKVAEVLDVTLDELVFVDSSNNLIDAEIEELQMQIEELERKKEDLRRCKK